MLDYLLSDREWSDAGVDLLGYADQRGDLLWRQRRISERHPDGWLEFAVHLSVEYQCNYLIHQHFDCRHLLRHRDRL